jgi:hypothetical protein
LVIKETVQEFKAYLDEAAEKAQTALAGDMAKASLSDTPVDADEDANGDEGSEGDDDDDDEDDGGELDYTPKEVQTVEAAVKLLGKALGCVKHSLLIGTGVCDRATALNAPGTPTTVFSSDAVAEATTVRQASQQWVAQLARLAQGIKKDVLDLGAELYPPFESDCSSIEERFAQLRTQSLEYLAVLDTEALRGLQTPADAEKIAHLVREVSECLLPTV